RDGSESIEGGGQGCRLHPVRELPGHDIAPSYAETRQRDGHAPRARLQVAEGKAPAPLPEALDEIRPVRIGPRTRFEKGREARLRPLAGGFGTGSALVGGPGTGHRARVPDLQGWRP